MVLAFYKFFEDWMDGKTVEGVGELFELLTTMRFDNVTL